MRLTPDQYRVLSQVKSSPFWTAYEALLRAMLDDADVTMRTAIGERIGWKQGEAQFLAQHLADFEKADELKHPPK